MKTLKSAVLFCLIFCTVVSAAESSNLLKKSQESVVVKEVTGQGGTRDGAIRDGLYRAVEQVRGVKVDSGSYKFVFGGAGVGIGTEQPEERRVEFDSVGVATKGTAYTTEIEGLVKTYEVVEESKTEEGAYQVKLKVTVYDSEASDIIKRIKIAMMPPKPLYDKYSFLNLGMSGETLSILFGQRLIAGLMQTNKFAVLERGSINDFEIEKKILEAHSASISELANLSSTVGADYLLIGGISEAKLWRIDKVLKAANYTTTEFKGSFTFGYRLVDSSSKQVVLAGGVQKYLDNEEVRALSIEQDPREWDPAQLRDALISLVVNDVIHSITDRVSPIKVASVQAEGQVILNQGGVRMKEGMLLEIFTMGEEIFDVDTQESLGRVENLVATVEVQRVEPTMSFAKVVEGDASKVSTGLVCRVKEVQKSRTTGMRPDVTRTEKGGVKLPFDK
jgi:curli biogenesis system outer membrane secretion channel CsgG